MLTTTPLTTRTGLCAALLASLLLLLPTPGARAAHISASWLSGSGSWSDPGRWSSNPLVPNDGGGNPFDASLGSGTASLDVDVSIQAFTQTGGTLNGGFDLDTNGLLLWQGGTHGGSGITNALGGIEIVGNLSRTLADRSLVSSATAAHRGGTVFFGGDASIQNTGTWISDSSVGAGGTGGTLSLANTGTGTRTFDNQGTFRKQGSQRSNVSPVFTNSGSVEVQSGVLAMYGGYTQLAGTTLLLGGELESGSALDIQGGALGGTGLVDDDILMDGTLAAGSSAGQLDVDGALSLQGSALFDVETGGALQATEYDFVDVTGDVTLGGLLQVTLIDGFELGVTASDTFTVLETAGALAGAFANVASGDRLATLGGYSFQVDYGATSPFGATTVVLSSFSAVPEPSSAGLLLLARRGRRRALQR